MVIRLYRAVVPLLWLAGLAEGMPDPSQRDLLMREEALRQTGGRVVLTATEQKLDARLHRLKEKELSAAQFPPAMHFFRAKTLIQESPIFKLLQRMPKGNGGRKVDTHFLNQFVCCWHLFMCLKPLYFHDKLKQTVLAAWTHF